MKMEVRYGAYAGYIKKYTETPEPNMITDWELDRQQVVDAAREYKDTCEDSNRKVWVVVRTILEEIIYI